METKQDVKEMKIYPVEIELTENFLEKNPTIKEIYENGKLKVSMNPDIDSETAKTITDVIGGLKSRELVLFNPMLEAINSLAAFKNVVGTAKPIKEEGVDDKDYEKSVKEWIKSEDVAYKEITGTIRKFNGAATASKKEIKEPLLEEARKVDLLYNTLKSFSESVKAKAEKNFKPLIDEKQSILEAKDKAAKQQELQQIADLENKNQEANEKLLEAQKKNSYADLMVELTSWYSDQESKISKSNISGLQELRKEVEEKSFNFSSIPGPMEQINLEKLQKTLKTGCLLKIDTAIGNEDQTATKAEIEEQQEQESKGGDDIGAFVNIIFRLQNAHSEISKIKCEFSDERLKKVQEKLEIQFSALKENIAAIQRFTEKKRDIYKNL